MPIPNGSDISVIQLKEEVSDIEVANKCLYIRKFYPDLLAELRHYKRTVLLGNPGTGKSILFYYYLARICNTDKFGELPPDFRGQTAPPEVIVYQIGNDRLIVLFVKLQLAHAIAKRDVDVLSSFDPKTTLYIFDPGYDVCTPLKCELATPTLLLVSPNEIRYKEFVKHSGVKVFMPCFTDTELFAIGKHMREQPDFPNNLISLYTDDALQQRYHDFGGIIRHVCPSTERDIRNSYESQLNAINRCNAQKILSADYLEDPSVSHFIAQYVVSSFSGAEAFSSRSTTLQIVSDNVRSSLEKELVKISFTELLAAMRKITFVGSVGQSPPLVYERLVTEMLRPPQEMRMNRASLWGNGVPTVRDPTIIKYSPDASTDWVPDSLQLRDVRSEIPSYATMETDVLYYPPLLTFPLVDCFYKDGNGMIIGIQVTTSANVVLEITESVVQNFLKQIDSNTNTAMIFVLIPLPFYARDATIEYPGSYFRDIQIWELPNNFYT